MELDLDNVGTPQAQAKQATQVEMKRRSQDRISVYNPLLEDYTVRFDSIGFIIPNRNKDNGHGLGKAVVFRYVAENYRTQIIDLILTSKMDEAVRLENKRRADLGMLPMSKFIGGEELMFTQSLRTDNMEARKRLIPIVWLGLAERYGTETREESLSGKPKDDRPMDERLADEVDATMRKEASKTEEMPTDATSPTAPSPTPSQDLKTKGIFTLQKMAREKGIEFDKKMKKNELIAKISA